jgi:succinoglycan biosynthesis transport protein ExoP
MRYISVEKKKEVDLFEFWRVILKRNWVIISFAGSLILFTGILSFTATPIYKATTSLLIEEEASKILSIEDEFGYRRQMEDLRFFKTQLKLIESKSLAERVARKMNLLSRPEFGGVKKPKRNILASVKNFMTFKWIKPKKNSEGIESGGSNPTIPSNPYSTIAESIRQNIQVSSVRDTKLVEVSYKSPNPILSAELINTLAEEFINFSVEKRYETTQQASDFLSENIANLREDLATKERELQRYGKEKELFFLSDTESTTVNKFADVTKAYTQAQIDRIKAEAAYRELRDLDVDSLPHFVNNLTIQSLKTEYARIKNEFEEKSKKFKPGYPEMVTLKAKLDSAREELRNEIKKAVDAAESEYNSALKKESSLQKLLENQRADVIRMDSNAILYNSIKIEVENMRNLLNSLVERQSETLVSARLSGLKTSNITIIDKAEVPKTPISPKKKLNLIMALIVGIFGGVGLCFLLEYLDNTVKGPEEVEKLSGLPSLGVIPYLPPEGMIKKKRYRRYSRYRHKYSYSYKKENPESEDAAPEIKEIELVNYTHPKFMISEDYRTVRTSILLSHAERPPKTIVFTSALPKEGKTATLVNMAVAFSQLKERVLVVDSDLRKPRLHRIFKAKNIGGLSGYLTGKVPIEEAVQKSDVENIWLLPSGPIPPNPAELLNSNKMKVIMEELKKGFDVILLDTPPVLVVVDPVIVSSLADSTVFIIEAGETTRKPFIQAVEELGRANAKIIGVVFNEVKAKDEGYYFPLYNYYRYRYDYYGAEGEKKPH